MSFNPPQTLSVKRKRHEHPVNQLQLEYGEKRQKSEKFTWRLVQKPGAPVPPLSLPSPAQPGRRFNLESKGVLIEARLPADGQDTKNSKSDAAQSIPRVKAPETASVSVQEATPRPRKRPGAGTAVHSAKPAVTAKKAEGTGPSEEQVRQFEQFSEEVEGDELAKSRPPPGPLKYKPKVPALRYKERHPEKAADPDAMDVDEYVFDTYVREVVVPSANGKMPEPQGTVGIIVLNEEDEEWWNGDGESDKEFDTDDEDENAEDYYANDYPEDEMSSDDENGRSLYQRKFRHGSDDEEYDLDNEDDGARSDEDEDDEHFRRIAPRSQPGYWGRFGE